MPPEKAREATPDDAVDGVQPRWVVEAETAEELSRILAWAEREQLKVVPRGGRTKLDWGNPPERADLVLSTRRLNRVVEHAAGDMTATVGAGCTIADFQRTLAQNGQRLALDPVFPDRATVGGVLATNDGGALRCAFGSLRDLVLGVTVGLPDGTLARSGGKVVKNVAGYDLPKLMTGALGTLGVITEATFRLHPLPQVVRELAWNAPTLRDAGRFLLSVQASTLAVAAIEVATTRNRPTRVQVRIEGSQAGVESATQRLAVLSTPCGMTRAEIPADGPNRERLWQGIGEADAVCKVTCLPAQLGELCDSVDRCERWALVAHAPGLGLLRAGAPNSDGLTKTLSSLRGELRASGGSLVVLSAAADVKRRLDAWGDVGDSIALMRRVKERFDPSRVLNPGRFVGGI